MQVLVEVGVVNGQHATALLHPLLVRADALRDVLQAARCKGLVLDAHSQDEGVVGDDLSVVEDDVLVGAVNVGDARVNDINAGLKHELLKLLKRVTCGVALHVALLVSAVMVRKTTWGDQGDVRELQVADGQQGLDERDTCV